MMVEIKVDSKFIHWNGELRVLRQVSCMFMEWIVFGSHLIILFRLYPAPSLLHYRERIFLFHMSCEPVQLEEITNDWQSVHFWMG